MSRNDKLLRQHLLYLLQGDGAHLDFASALKDFPTELRSVRPQGASHSPWEVLEHLRIGQRDVLDSILDAKHTSPDFPSGYWPKTAAPPDAKEWDRSMESFQTDLEQLARLIGNPETNLLGPLHNNDSQSIFRKVAMAADHTAYHLGELVLLRRILGAWH